MLTIILTVLFVIACFILIAVVLLQSGKADAAQLFGGGGATTFGPRGTATILQKVTVGAAVAYMVITFLFMMGIGGPRSAAGGIQDRTPVQVPAPAAPTATPGAPVTPTIPNPEPPNPTPGNPTGATPGGNPGAPAPAVPAPGQPKK